LLNPKIITVSAHSLGISEKLSTLNNLAGVDDELEELPVGFSNQIYLNLYAES